MVTFKSLSIQQKMDILSDKTWTKAIFLRDPASRYSALYNYLVMDYKLNVQYRQNTIGIHVFD
jgi:hypothetical protein